MPNSLTLDHVIPLAKGGPDTFDNTVAACHACNQAKGMLDLGEFSTHPIRLQRLTAANTAPERLSADEKSPYYSKAALDREVRVFFNERERFDVHEYSVTETVGGISTTFGDWYLPSRYELNLLYIQKTVVGGFAADNYWSSSESGNARAYYQNFNTGVQSFYFKDEIDRVRAIRAF
jgi:hypothetical protein